MLCAVAMADGCGDEPALIATYGDEIGRLVRRHMPTIMLERDSRALPVDFRRCRATACGDGTPRGLVHLTDEREHVTAFVHVVDCRAEPVGGADCSGPRHGYLYLQYWLYYADSATLRGVPIAEDEGYHHDDWESVDLRIAPDGRRRRARLLAPRLQLRPERRQRGLGHRLGRPARSRRSRRRPPAGRLGAGDRAPSSSPAAATPATPAASSATSTASSPAAASTSSRWSRSPRAEGDAYRFAVTPPWRKRVWRDPEAAGTD